MRTNVWEYEWEYFDAGSFSSLEIDLDQRGECGWEAWHMERSTNGGFHVLFKREKPAKNDERIQKLLDAARQVVSSSQNWKQASPSNRAVNTSALNRLEVILKSISQ